MTDQSWIKTDEYLDNLLFKGDSLSEDVFEANKAAGLPAIDVSPPQGYFLNLITKISGASQILEIGTLGGYSTIHFARGIPGCGKVTSLEVSPEHAEVARKNIEKAGCGGKVEVIVGKAVDTLPQLTGPFDIVFIDADKESMPIYLEHAMKLTKPGSIIIGDNVVRSGKVANDPPADSQVRGAQEFLQQVAANPKLEATVLQTVGSKGHDGFCFARVCA